MTRAAVCEELREHPGLTDDLHEVGFVRDRTAAVLYASGSATSGCRYHVPKPSGPAGTVQTAPGIDRGAELAGTGVDEPGVAGCAAPLIAVVRTLVSLIG